MYILQTQKELFISSGKIGTQTLGTISNSQHIKNFDYPIINPQDCKNSDEVLLNRLKSYKQLHPNHTINFVIRYPYYRFVSGLFEIFGKSLVYIVSDQLKIYLKDDVTKIIPMFYDTDMWIKLINNSLLHLPTFDKNKKLSGNWLDYHLGNWLHTVEFISQNIDVNIIDIDDLTLYLRKNEYDFSYKNRSSDIIIGALARGSHIDTAKNISQNMNAEKMMAAYRKAVSCCDRSSEFQQYIREENEIYQRLLAKKLIVDPNNSSLKIF